MTANSTPESFAAVLAEMRCPLVTTRDIPHDVVERMFRNIADRLAAAHAAEVEKLRDELATCDRNLRDAMGTIAAGDSRADAAMGLLRECLQFVPDDLADRVAGMVGRE